MTTAVTDIDVLARKVQELERTVSTLTTAVSAQAVQLDALDGKVTSIEGTK